MTTLPPVEGSDFLIDLQYLMPQELDVSTRLTAPIAVRSTAKTVVTLAVVFWSLEGSPLHRTDDNRSALVFDVAGRLRCFGLLRRSTLMDAAFLHLTGRCRSGEMETTQVSHVTNVGDQGGGVVNDQNAHGFLLAVVRFKETTMDLLF